MASNRRNLDNNNQPPNPQQPTTPFSLSQQHYEEWIRLQKKSARLSESIFKFIFQLVSHLGEAGTLVVTLIFGVIIPTEDTTETVIAAVLYVMTCIVTAAINWKNEENTIQSGKGRMRKDPKERKIDFLLNLLGVLKPVRYGKMFVTRKEKLRIIREHSERNGDDVTQIITKGGLEALSELQAEELKDKGAELNEAFLQSVPMMLLQTYFLFGEKIELCHWGDVTRIAHIFIVIFQAAKAAAEYDAGKADHESSLHFLSFYVSKGAHPLRIYTRKMMSIAGMANLVSHFCSILFTVYTVAYLLKTVSWIAAILFVVIKFVVNLIILTLFPQTLLEVQENAPFGVATAASYYTERFINVFCNVGTRYNKFSGDIKLLSNTNNRRWFRLPLPFWQIIHFAVPLVVIFLCCGHLIAEKGGDEEIVASNLNDTFSKCPKAEEWYNANAATRSFGNWFFGAVYTPVNDKLQSIDNLFGFFHVIWLLHVAQVVYALVFAYADLMMRRRDPSTVQAEQGFYFDDAYPIVSGYAFWGILIDHSLGGAGVNNSSWGRNVTKNMVRKLMLLTILRDEQFYKLVRYFCGICGKKSKLEDERCKTEIKKLIGNLTETEAEVDNFIRDCFAHGHALEAKFRKIYDVLVADEGGNGNTDCRDWNALLEKSDDKKLFLAFFSTFDMKIYRMRSDRIGRIFEIMGCEIGKKVGDGRDD